jgi:hypothetical protein
MRHTLLLCAIGVALTSCTAAGSQAPDNAALPASLRAHLQGDRFQIFASLRGLPFGVRDALQGQFGASTLDIAEPGAPFQATDVVTTPNLPARRLVAAGCSTDHCIVYFERGGIAHTWHVMVFHWTPAETRFEWGGTPAGGLTTIDQVRTAILSGSVKGSTGPW